MARIIYDTSEETRVWEIARMREKALHDEASALRDATDKGIAIGEERQRKTMIEKMRAMDCSEEFINAIFVQAVFSVCYNILHPLCLWLLLAFTRFDIWSQIFNTSLSTFFLYK